MILNINMNRVAYLKGVASLLFCCIFLLAGYNIQAQVKNIKVPAAERKIRQHVTVIDVRTHEEYAAGHIDGALLINIKDTADFFEAINKLPRNQPYLIYCRTGKRSAAAATLMAANNFTRLYNLKGGYVAWKKKQSD